MAASHVELVIRRPGLPDRRIVLESGTMSIGRADDNDIVLSDIGVSRRHAKLHVDDEGVEYEDNGSGNGSVFNGRRLKRQRLNDGDEIVIDPFRLQVLLAAETDEANMSTASTLKLGGLEDGFARLELVSNHRMDRTAFEVPAEATITLGRGERNDIVLPEPAASRVNSEIVGHLGVWTVRDRASSNGTFVNGRKVREQVLKDGDKLKIGTVELKFFAPGGEGTANFAASQPDTPTRTRAPIAPPTPASQARATQPAPAAIPAPTASRAPVTPSSSASSAPRQTSNSLAPQRPQASPNPSAGRPSVVRPADVAPTVGAAKPGVFANPVNTAIAAVVALAVCGIGLVACIVLGTVVYKQHAATQTATVALSPTQAGEVERLLQDGRKLESEGKFFDAAAQFYKVLQIDGKNPVAERLGYRACTEIAFAEMRTTLPPPVAAPVAPLPVEPVAAAVAPASPAPVAPEPAQTRIAPVRTTASPPPPTPSRTTASHALPDLSSAYNRGQALADAGDEAGAIKQWQSVMNQDPDQVTPEYYKAQASIRSAKDQLKSEGDKHYQAALTALNAKQYPTARQQLEQAVAADPFNNAARAKLTEVQDELGAQAQDIYKEARIQEDIDKTSDAIRMYRQVIALVGETDELGAKAKRRMDALQAAR